MRGYFVSFYDQKGDISPGCLSDAQYLSTAILRRNSQWHGVAQGTRDILKRTWEAIHTATANHCEAFLWHFSGHGCDYPSTIAPSAVLDFNHRPVPVEDVIRVIRQGNPAIPVLLIVDACRKGVCGVPVKAYEVAEGTGPHAVVHAVSPGRLAYGDWGKHLSLTHAFALVLERADPRPIDCVSVIRRAIELLDDNPEGLVQMPVFTSTGRNFYF